MMPDLETRLNTLTNHGALTHASDEIWMDAPQLNVIDMAVLAAELGMRLSTITGIALEDGETQLIYHFVAGSTVLNVKVRTSANTMLSITPRMPSANWIEREIHDLYAVDFLGHPHLERFIRPPDLPLGFFREKGGEAGKHHREQAHKNAS